MTQRLTHYEGDCLQIMPTLTPESFDLLLTDPPYAMPATYYQGRNVIRRWSDTSIMQGWWRLVMKTAMPLMKPDGMVVVFANAGAISAFWPNMFEIMSLSLAVWDKGSFGMGAPLRNTCEYMIIGSIGQHYIANRKTGNIFRYDRVHHKNRIHQAQKPAPLISDLVELFCPAKGNVIDPFAGSCSTATACQNLGRTCTTIEWESDEPDEQIALFEEIKRSPDAEGP